MSSIIFRLETPRLFLQLNSDEDPRASFCYSLSPPLREQRHCEIGNFFLDSAVKSILFYTSPNPPSNYTIVLKETAVKIGIIGFFKWDPVKKSGGVGFSLYQPYRNQGMMTEAARAFIDVWFRQGDLSWIEGKCQPENKASEKVLVKSGMTFRKSVEEPLYKGSRLYRLNVYGISKNEWLTLPI
jgi:RimJ/RimL family protein N-acetyltransferase